MSLAERVEVQGLPELAEVANREHGLAIQAGTSMIQHAINAGEALLAAKEQVPYGAWQDWLADNFAHSTGQQYMRLARHKQLVIEGQATTIKGALRLLHGGQDSRADPLLLAEVQRMRSQGLSYGAITEALDLPKTTVARWCNPKAERRRLARAHQRTIAGRRALNRQKRDRAATKAGGAVAEAYSLVRKALQACEQASKETDNREVRKALSDATNRLYNAEDALIRAVGIQ